MWFWPWYINIHRLFSLAYLLLLCHAAVSSSLLLRRRIRNKVQTVTHWSSKLIPIFHSWKKKCFGYSKHCSNPTGLSLRREFCLCPLHLKNITQKSQRRVTFVSSSNITTQTKKRKFSFTTISRANRSFLNALCCANTNLRQLYRASYLSSVTASLLGDGTIITCF